MACKKVWHVHGCTRSLPQGRRPATAGPISARSATQHRGSGAVSAVALTSDVQASSQQKGGAPKPGGSSVGRSIGLEEIVSVVGEGNTMINTQYSCTVNLLLRAMPPPVEV